MRFSRNRQNTASQQMLLFTEELSYWGQVSLFYTTHVVFILFFLNVTCHIFFCWYLFFVCSFFFRFLKKILRSTILASKKLCSSVILICMPCRVARASYHIAHPLFLSTTRWMRNITLLIWRAQFLQCIDRAVSYHILHIAWSEVLYLAYICTQLMDYRKYLVLRRTEQK